MIPTQDSQLQVLTPDVEHDVHIETVSCILLTVCWKQQAIINF